MGLAFLYADEFVSSDGPRSMFASSWSVAESEDQDSASLHL
jgi:hypothetical protein